MKTLRTPKLHLPVKQYFMDWRSTPTIVCRCWPSPQEAMEWGVSPSIVKLSKTVSKQVFKNTLCIFLCMKIQQKFFKSSAFCIWCYKFCNSLYQISLNRSCGWGWAAFKRFRVRNVPSFWTLRTLNTWTNMLILMLVSVEKNVKVSVYFPTQFNTNIILEPVWKYFNEWMKNLIIISSGAIQRI